MTRTWRRRWWGIIGAVAATGVITGSVITGSVQTPVDTAPGTANLWVDGSGTCTRSSTAVAYNSATACTNLNTAYAAASLGDKVLVKGGTYTQPLIADVSAKDGTGVSPVVIEEAPGESVILNDLATAASNIVLKGFEVDHDGGIDPVGNPDIRTGSHDVTLDGIVSTTLFITSATDVVVKNSEFGPYDVLGSGSQIKTYNNNGDDPDQSTWPKRITLDNVYFHDYSTSQPNHMDCLHVFFHQTVTIKNSRFIDCFNYGVLLGGNGPGVSEHDVIENNVFVPSSGSDGVAGFAFRGGCGPSNPNEYFDDVLVRNNSGGYITPQASCSTNVRFIANVSSVDVGPCNSGITFAYNVSPVSDCSGTDLAANPLFTNAGANDYTLQSGSPAIGHGDPTNYPSLDLLGHSRPFGSLPDAGAYEFGAS